MLKGQILGYTLCNIDLALEAVDASVSTICLCHNSTDAAADHRSFQNTCSDGNAVNLASSKVGFATANVRFHRIFEFGILLSCVDGRLEKHIVYGGLVFFLLVLALVNFHDLRV